MVYFNWLFREPNKNEFLHSLQFFIYYTCEFFSNLIIDFRNLFQQVVAITSYFLPN